jgi:hypothetical protein
VAISWQSDSSSAVSASAARRSNASKLAPLSAPGGDRGRSNSQKFTLGIADMRLEPRPPNAADFAKLLKIDVQPRAAPVESGFTGWYGDAYTALRGYVLGLGPRFLLALRKGRARPEPPLTPCT